MRSHDDLLPVSTMHSETDVAAFAIDIMKASLSGVAAGLADTGEDAVRGCLKLARGDLSGAAQIAGDRLSRMVVVSDDAIESTVSIAQAAVDAVKDEKPFCSETNREHLTRLCQTGILLAAGASVIGSD